ncbi:MAG: hypothetical protein JOZ62_04605 [Acidobacteriaceae bacterium]|nr:hypothetical protein [Acidobacteriaceae bacterium]
MHRTRYTSSYKSGRRGQGRQFWAHLILISIVADVLFAQRVILSFSTGGRGNLLVLDVWLPVLAALLLIGVGTSRGVGLLHADASSLFWWPYVLLTIALPILAVLVQNYPVRNLYSSVSGFVALAFFILGAWIASADEDVLKLVQVYAWIAVVGECLFAVIDYLNKTGLYKTWIGEFLLHWNVASEDTLGQYSALTWRCVGTFVSPNELGFWSVLAFWLSALLPLRGILRFTAIIAALMTLVLSQSRGSLFALFGTIAVWVAYLALSRDRSLARARDITYFSVICGFLALAWTAGLLSDIHITVASEFSFIERFQSGLQVLTQGAGADRNAEARVEAWRRALAFYYVHPLGTWASPGLLFRHYIDNDYVRTFVQGTPVYLTAVLLALYGGFRRIVRSGIASRITALFSVAIAIDALSAHPFMYPAIGVYWLSMGYDLAAERSASRSAERSAFHVRRQVLAGHECLAELPHQQINRSVRAPC